MSTSQYTLPDAPPSTPQPSKATTPVPCDDDDDFMPETTSPFWGDDEHGEENPQDFLKAMQRWGLNKSNATNAQKLENFGLNLKSNSVAEQWWDALPTNDNDTWDHLVSTFKKCWPSKAPTVKTIEEKQAALEGTRISEEEVGKHVMTNGIEEFAHVVWADKIEKLTAAIPDANGLLISTVRKSMPKALQKVTGSGHTTWTAFCRAVRTATLSQIDEAKGEEKEARDLREQVKKLQELCNASTRDVTNAFQRLTVNTPSPTPRFPILRTQQPTPHNYPPAQTFNANNQPPARAAHHAPNRQHRPPAERMNDVIRFALLIHPNNPAGWALYNAQITQWNNENPGQYVSEMRPYPLSPGTTPVASGECWKCGMLGHRNANCESTNPVPVLEGRWRSIAVSIKCSCPLTTTENVNYINTASPWASKEYDQQVIAEFLASQGKEQGSSA